MAIAAPLRGDEPAPATRLTISPPEFRLLGQRERLQLLATASDAAGRERDVTAEVTWTSSAPQCVELEGATAIPREVGVATLTAEYQGLRATATVEVAAREQPQTVSFLYDTLPALSKQGCNSGACHGSPSGKGGFRLSLRAFDPELDAKTLVREELGRRTNPLEPDASLLLRKPLMETPHGGGRQLVMNSPAHVALRDWIGEGCRIDPAETARCVGIEVLPGKSRILHAPAWRQQLTVQARFADGSLRDVTALTLFSSSDERVASVTVDGLAAGQRRGEAAIMVRYLEFVESVSLTFIEEVAGFAWPSPPEHNYIDELVDAKLQQLQYLPSPVCTDDEFLRRVHLDLIGRLPTVEETRAFLTDSATDKRERLIDSLLESEDHAEFWALKWGDVLRLTNAKAGVEGVHKYHRWLVRALRENLPYDQFARELLTASGSTLTNPPATFYRAAADTNDCVESISQLFLGARLQCAKCHNHPFERWTQDNYYGMAAFFERVQRTATKRPDEFFVWVSDQGEVTQPRTGKQMRPWAPGVGELSLGDEDRRVAFADWLTSAENPFFARVEVNRIWSQLLGRGIVEPSDDFRDSNPPANGPLLDALAADFTKHGFDRRHILRTILRSRAYQTSFVPLPLNEEDDRYGSHFQPRMLSAEQLLDAICQVTEVAEPFAGFPAGTHATQIPAPDLVKNEFLKAFGQPERQTVCACERTRDSNLGMAIQFFNGTLMHTKVGHAQSRMRRLATAGVDDRAILDELYLAALCRSPSPEELATSLRHLEAKRIEVETGAEQMLADIERLKQSNATLLSAAETRIKAARLDAIPEPIRADLVAALAQAEGERNEVGKYLVAKLGPQVAITPEIVQQGLTAEEQTKLAEDTTELKRLEAAPKDVAAARQAALEDICWALLNSNEFLFQH